MAYLEPAFNPESKPQNRSDRIAQIRLGSKTRTLARMFSQVPFLKIFYKTPQVSKALFAKLLKFSPKGKRQKTYL